MRKHKHIDARFWALVEKTDSCWNWTGALSTSGYGVLQRGPRGGGLVRAHRHSFAMHNGREPEQLVLHRCNNKLCVNPEHLFDGSYSQNLADAWRDGLRKPRKARHAIPA